MTAGCEILCSTSEGETVNLRFPDGSCKSVPMAIISRSATIHECLHLANAENKFALNIPGGHLQNWLECALTLFTKPREDAGQIDAGTLVRYIKVCVIFQRFFGLITLFACRLRDICVVSLFRLQTLHPRINHSSRSCLGYVCCML